MLDVRAAGGDRTPSLTHRVIAALLLGVLLAAGCSVDAERAGPGLATPTRPAATPPATGAATPATSAAPSVHSRLPGVAAADLPAEARRTLVLIDRRGPFPYRRDGAVFGNRERLLPIRGPAYYREYTVPTPGERDRGPRRIVAGQRGERYYTADHYRSFREIRP